MFSLPTDLDSVVGTPLSSDVDASLLMFCVSSSGLLLAKSSGIACCIAPFVVAKVVPASSVLVVDSALSLASLRGVDGLDAFGRGGGVGIFVSTSTLVDAGDVLSGFLSAALPFVSSSRLFSQRGSIGWMKPGLPILCLVSV